MKKYLLFSFSLMFIFSAAIVLAKVEKNEKDFSKPLKVEKVKLEEKKVVPLKDKEKFENLVLKGGPPSHPGRGKDKDNTNEKWATGHLGDEVEGEKYAIVIGLSNYPGVSYTKDDKILSDLCVIQVPDNYPSYGGDDPSYEDEVRNNCKDGDALTMEETLMNKYGYTEKNIHTFSDADATFTDIKTAVDEIKDVLKEGDEVVFFFSGHGVTSNGEDVDGDGEAEEGDDEGIVVYDGNYKEDLYMEDTPTPYEGYANYAEYYNSTGYDISAYIWDGQIKGWFKDVPTTRILFVFDTCKAGGMNDLEEDGRVLALASTEYQGAWTYYLGGEDNSGNIHDGEGLFTHYFVKRAMLDGYADGYNQLKKKDKNPGKYDELIAVEEAFGYSYGKVKDYTSSMQTPVLNDEFANDLLLGYQVP